MNSELWVIGTVAGHKVSFLTDTGTCHFYPPLRVLSNLHKWPSKGVSGIPFYPKITPPLLCSFDKTTLTHSYKVVSQCLMALIGRDLLAKLQTSINLPSLDPVPILCIEMAPEPLASPHSQNLPPDLPPIDPQVWVTESSLVALHHSPVQVFLKNPSGNNPNSIYPDHRIPTKT